jgi:hypothetical protein
MARPGEGLTVTSPPAGLLRLRLKAWHIDECGGPRCLPRQRFASASTATV